MFPNFEPFVEFADIGGDQWLCESRDRCTTPAFSFLLWPRGLIVYLYRADVRLPRSAESCRYHPSRKIGRARAIYGLFNLVKQQSVTGRLQGRNPFDRPILVRLDESPTGRTRERRLPSAVGDRQLYRADLVRSFAGLSFIDFELGGRSVDAHFSISAGAPKNPCAAVRASSCKRGAGLLAVSARLHAI